MDPSVRWDDELMFYVGTSAFLALLLFFTYAFLALLPFRHCCVSSTTALLTTNSMLAQHLRRSRLKDDRLIPRASAIPLTHRRQFDC